MCQLRLELLYSRNIMAIDKSLNTYKQKIAIPPKNNEQIGLNEDNEDEICILLEDDTDTDMSVREQNQTNTEPPEIVRSVNDWKAIVEQWINLTEEEENDYMQCDSFSLNESDDEEAFQNYIHPADNLAAKWKLENVFVDLLAQPAFLNLLLGD